MFRRREIPWEVVDSKHVDPVPVYYEDEDLEVDIVQQRNVRRKYVLQVKPDARLSHELRKAVVFARAQLLEELRRYGYNVLLLESWSVTLLRRGQSYRIEVEYRCRPAHAVKEVTQRSPPFMDVLQHDTNHGSETQITKKQSNGLLLFTRLSRRLSTCSLLIKS